MPDLQDHTESAADQLEGWLAELSRRARAAEPIPVTVLTVPRRDGAWSLPRSGEVPVATEGQDAVEGMLGEIYRDLRERGLPCARPVAPSHAEETEEPASGWAFADALRILDRLSTKEAWVSVARGPYASLRFPRSQLLSDLEHAVTEASDGEGEPERDAVMTRWSRRYLSGPLDRLVSALRSPGMGLTAVGALVFGSALPALFDHMSWGVLLATLIALALVGLAAMVLRGLGVFLRFGRRSSGSARKWLVTTSFLLVEPTYAGGEGRFTQRAGLVVDMLLDARVAGGHGSEEVPDPQLGYLQLRVWALLADIEENYRRRTLDARRRKRPAPPVVVLPDAGAGSWLVVRTISDIRSRRSEIDPLVVITNRGRGLRYSDFSAYERGPVRRWDHVYDGWLAALRVRQSPSRSIAVPWALLLGVSEGALAVDHRYGEVPASRPNLWYWLWGWRGLTAAALVLAAIALPVHLDRMHTYCGGRLWAYDPGLRWAGPQCIGIDAHSGGRYFVPEDGGVDLTGALPGAHSHGPGANVRLADLEQGIEAQNHLVGKRFVTVVYAGPLTVRGRTEEQAAYNRTSEAEALGTVKEVAGVLAWQRHVNAPSGPRTKLKVLLANTGEHEDHLVPAVRAITRAAEADRSIVGVAGLGRDTTNMLSAVRTLAQAGLALLDTTNSDDQLADEWNYFGLSATNTEEARALGARLPRPRGRASAVVLERTTTPADPYSSQQAVAGAAMLHDLGYQVAGGRPLGFRPGDLGSALDSGPAQSAVCRSRPSVVYLAGRSDDLQQLADLLRGRYSCFAGRVTVLSGDDLTKNELTAPLGLKRPLPASATLMYAALTDTPKVAEHSDLGDDFAGVVSGDGGYDAALFGSGNVALGYDAAQALYAAATGHNHGYAGVEYSLRCRSVGSGATGTLGWHDVRHGFAIVTTGPGGADPRVLDNAAGQAPSYRGTTSGVC